MNESNALQSSPQKHHVYNMYFKLRTQFPLSDMDESVDAECSFSSSFLSMANDT